MADAEIVPNGSNVLVVANKAWTGRDGSEKGESEGVARYYMKRRGVPEQNLLLVDIAPAGPPYELFHQRVIVPVSEKLKILRGDDAPRGRGETSTDPILYILCCYGVPVRVEVNSSKTGKKYPGEWKEPKYNQDGAIVLEDFARYPSPRSADSFLCYPHVLAKLKPDEAPESNRYAFGDVFDKYSFAPPVVHPYFGKAVEPGPNPSPVPGRIGFGVSPQKGPAISFGEARRKDNCKYAYYLVCRLDAPNPRVARSLVDKAIYAEKHLVNPAEGGAGSWRTEAVFDLGELKTSNVHIQDAIDWFSGRIPGSPFEGKPWPMTVDTGTGAGQEIGVPGRDGMPYRPNDPRFEGRDFPLTNVVWYCGNYTDYGKYQDVYQWAVGSVAMHVDSGSCADLHASRFDSWVEGRDYRAGFVPPALMRNLTAATGVVHEPFEDGITLVNFLFRALSLGMCFGDACYAATRDIWWKSVFIGDPLYRPFGGPKSPDAEPPKFILCRVEKRANAFFVSAETDKPCQISIQAGNTVLRPFSRWGKTWEERDWFFACEFAGEVSQADVLASAKDAKEWTVSALSPAGLVTTRRVSP